MFVTNRARNGSFDTSISNVMHQPLRNCTSTAVSGVHCEPSHTWPSMCGYVTWLLLIWKIMLPESLSKLIHMLCLQKYRADSVVLQNGVPEINPILVCRITHLNSAPSIACCIHEVQRTCCHISTRWAFLASIGRHSHLEAEILQP